jgi:hypothetical protein
MKTVGNTTFQVPTANTLCTLATRVPRTVPAQEMAQRAADLKQTPRFGSEAMALWERYDAPRVVGNESAIENEYGLEAMSQLADRIVRLARQGTTREQYIGQFDMTTHHHQYVYAVKANGEMLRFLHEWGVDRNPPGAAPGVARPLSPGAREMVTQPAPAPAPSSGGAVTGPSPSTKRIITGGEIAKDSMVVRRGPNPAVEAIKGTLATAPRVSHKLDTPKLVGSGWQTYSLVIPAGKSGVYGMLPNGVLRWFRHDGYQDGSPRWKGPVDVGTGWHSFKKIVAGGDGVLYGILPDGTLRWNRHLDAADSSSRPNWAVARNVGTGWGHFPHVFSGGDGIIYAATPEGKLLWYRHRGFLTGAVDWEGPKEVGNAGWAYFKRLFSPGDGVIYAVLPEGDLLWYQNEGYQDGSARWQPGGRPSKLAADWRDFVQVFPLMWGKSSEPIVK